MDAAHVSLFFWLAATSWSRFPRHNNHSSIRLLSTEWGGNGGGGRKGIAATGGAGGEPWEGAGGNAGGLWGMYTRMLSEFPVGALLVAVAHVSLLSVGIMHSAELDVASWHALLFICVSI